MSYQIFYWTHIFSYIVWLLAFIASLLYGFKIRTQDDAVKKRTFMRSERLVTSIGTHIGVLGILISGGAIASIPSGPQWGWFDVVLYPWLALKQILFIAILVLVGFSIKRSLAFKRMLQEEEVPSTQTSKQWRGAYRMSMIVYILVVINTVLGLAKPGIGF
jgi:uncharacterized membrane protein